MMIYFTDYYAKIISLGHILSIHKTFLLVNFKQALNPKIYYFCTVTRLEIKIMANRELNKDTNDKISFVCFIIPEFALAYKMNVQKAYQYLKQYGGIDYLNKN